ncbi:lipase 3-like [Galleria mellonella]|uniref:Lipase n=1 Tax=Galleria mellonella TaxID=7137 RepID=A0A6J1X491_GALME|nr:lipase 3-like [Galleria mellonella]
MDIHKYNIVFIIGAIYITFLEHHVSTLPAARQDTLESYSNSNIRSFKKALGYDEETYLNFTELATKYGYRTEEHTITTEDGYILKAFRILTNCQEPYKRPPVLLMHGVFDSSDVWIIAGKDIGIGYLLADYCYDVWALNHRGNKYSRKHVYYNPDTDMEFWNYSFDEHGNFDIPATIDYIIQVTKHKKLSYIGHSQGTTDFFAMASLKPEYNEKIRVSIQLAPVAWMTNIFNPILKVISPATHLLKIFLDSSGNSELLSENHLIQLMFEMLCQVVSKSFCISTLHATTGYEDGSIPTKTLVLAFSHVLSGTSSKSLAHFGQVIKSKHFQRYDEGTKGNVKRYGTPTPPKYNVSLITSPVVLICAENDWVSSLKDIDILSSKLSNLVEKYVVPEPKWSHHNHVWSTKLPNYVFPKIIEYLDKFN